MYHFHRLLTAFGKSLNPIVSRVDRYLYFLVKKVTFQIIFGHNCENTTVKKARNKDEGGFLV